jgi:hypothetical protein
MELNEVKRVKEGKEEGVGEGEGKSASANFSKEGATSKEMEFRAI